MMPDMVTLGDTVACCFMSVLAGSGVTLLLVAWYLRVGLRRRAILRAEDVVEMERRLAASLGKQEQFVEDVGGRLARAQGAWVAELERQASCTCPACEANRNPPPSKVN